MAQPTSALAITGLTLEQDASGRLTFSATGEPVIVDPATGAASPLPGTPAFTVGVGTAAPIPDRIRAAFDGTDVAVPLTAERTLFASADGAGTGAASWYLSLGASGVDLFGVQPLAASALTLGGATFADLELAIALETRGTAVERLFVRVGGRVSLTQALGPLDIAGASAAFTLEIDGGLDRLETILADPARLLDAAFIGRLRLSVDAARFAVGGALAIDQAAIEALLDVRSPTGQRALNVARIRFDVRAAQASIGAAGFAQLVLAGDALPADGAIRLRGSAEITLPAATDAVFDSATALVAELDLAHAPAASGAITELRVSVPELRLDPSINLLELSARDLELGFRHVEGAAEGWTLAVGGTVAQSWSRVAGQLASVFRLPALPGVPDIRGTLSLTLAEGDTSGSLRVELQLLQPGTAGASERPFDGMLPLLPVQLSDAAIALTLDFAQGTVSAWTVGGGAALTTREWLAVMMPLRDARVSIEVDSALDLVARVQGGLPSLALPPLLPGTAPLTLFALESVSLRLGDTIGVEATAICGVSNLAASLGLPAAWNPLLDPVSQLLDDLAVTVRVSAPARDQSQPAQVEVAAIFANPPTFRLMEALSPLVRGGAPASPSTANQVPAGDEFFQAAPDRLLFTASVASGAAPTLALSFAFLCDLFGERFDVTARLAVAGDQPEILLMAGLTDPIRLTVPGISPDAVLGAVDLNRLAADYRLASYDLDLQLFPNATTTNPVQALTDLEQQLRALFAGPGVDSTLVFEIRDFGLRVRFDESPTVSGTIRLIQLPLFLDAILPPNGFDFGLGCSVERLFISAKGPATRDASGRMVPHDSAPLFSVPLGQDAGGNDRFLHLYFGSFELEYHWTTTAFGFLLDAAVIPEPASLLNLNVAGNGVSIPAQKTFVRLSVPLATAVVPVVVPEWAISFKRDGSGTEVVETAADELGLQLYFGTPATRFVTLYFRESSFSPTYFLMQPGAVMDGGFIIGPHQPRDYVYSGSVRPPQRYDEFIDDLLGGEAGSAFLVHVGIERWQLVTYQAPLALMLNPLLAIPPFLFPMPPFLISPPSFLYGDVFADRLSFAVNLPGILFFSVDFSRPLPTLSLQGMLEIAALAMTGFQETIPPASDLRRVLYATLGVRAKLPLLAGLSGTTPELELDIEANVADLVNGFVTLANATRDTFQNGVDLVQRLMDDPTALVRMVPIEARRFAIPPAGTNGTYNILGLRFSGSLFLLTPEELEAELILFHESRRMRRRGLAGSRPGGTSAPAPSGPVLSNPGLVRFQDLANRTRRFTSNPLELFNPSDPGMQALFTRHTRAVDRAQKRAAARLAEFAKSRDELVEKFASMVIDDLSKTALRDRDDRKKTLDRYGLAAIRQGVEDALKASAPNETTQIAAWPAAARQAASAAIDKLIAQALDRFDVTRQLAAAPLALSTTLADALLRPSTARRRAASLVRLIDEDARAKVYQKLLGSPAIAKRMSASLEVCVEQAEQDLKTDPPQKPDAVERAKKRLAACLRATLEGAFPTTRVGASALGALGLDQAGVRARLTDVFKTTRRTGQRVVTDVLFDAGVTNRLWIKHLLRDRLLPGDTPRVEKVVGYEIRSRAAATPSGQRFSVPVPISSPVYRVRRIAGAYRLVVLAADGSEQSRHDLPAWLITGPDTPNKAQVIRGRLEVGERIERRARTAAEAAFADARPSDTAPHFYQSSILARPEYRIKDEGGLHGPFFIGDLLKGDAGYIVPDGPVLLGGIELSLWDNVVRLAGLLAPPDNIFLNGYHRITIDDPVISRFHLELEGEFRLIAGTMWRTALAGGSTGLTPDTLSFRGRATFRDGNTKKFEGTAEGTIRAIAGQLLPDLTLDVHIEFRDSWTVRVLDTDIFKVEMDSAFDLDVRLSSSGFRIEARGDLDVDAWAAVPTMKEVVIVEAFTVCSDVPRIPPPSVTGPFFRRECVTTPAVTVDVPDFDDLTWTELPAPDASLGLELGTNGLRIELTVEGVEDPIVIPALLN